MQANSYAEKKFQSSPGFMFFHHSRPQRPRSFWSHAAPRIATSGLVQRHSVFEWLCKHNRLRPEPIRFVKLDSERAQSDGKSVNRGLPVLDLVRSRFLVQTKRSAASGDENVFPFERRSAALGTRMFFHLSERLLQKQILLQRSKKYFCYLQKPLASAANVSLFPLQGNSFGEQFFREMS